MCGSIVESSPFWVSVIAIKSSFDDLRGNMNVIFLDRRKSS